ncbi:helix-turn-helix domain-containing protein [Bacillus mycoides]|uniref:HTH cro/C1-type domain-containing protein n=1 Tax=Bacillus cereus VD021 TaxID=1053224 RepID=R8GY51_BACCE|nr:helix-turn-helix transcriptional regulator [Bacillus cereus]EOO65506.1 hypothetical protein IIC_06116 [Bacillus cereus VD021]
MGGKYGKFYVRTARKQKGLKQQEVASKLGISRSYYATVEAKIRVPSLKVALDISELLDIDVKFFLD